MPELPDITVYIEALSARVMGATLIGIRVHGPAWVRTAVPPLREVEGRRVVGLRRIGKRISIAESEEPNVTDWDAFLAAAVKGKYLHLVQRRISAPAWRELRALKGKDIAGTEVFVKRSLSVRSVTAK